MVAYDNPRVAFTYTAHTAKRDPTIKPLNENASTPGLQTSGWTLTTHAPLEEEAIMANREASTTSI